MTTGDYWKNSECDCRSRSGCLRFRPACGGETIDMETSNGLEQRVRRRLADWEAGGLQRVLRPPAGLDFSSNDYLGLATEAAIATDCG